MIGSNYPLFIKFGIRDESEHGLKLEEGIQVAKWMIEAGINAIEVRRRHRFAARSYPEVKTGRTGARLLSRTLVWRLEKSPAECISCNLCHKELRANRRFVCGQRTY